MTVAMKPRTRISFWLVAGSLLLGLSALPVVHSSVAWGASLPIGVVGSSTAQAACCRRVDGMVARRADDAIIASRPLSQRTSAGTTNPQRAASRGATDSPVSIDRAPCGEVPRVAHLRTQSGRPIIFSLQSQHVRIQI